VRRSGYLDRWNVNEGRGGKDNGGQHVAEAMARHGSRQGTRMRTTGADKDMRQGIELAGIVSVSLIPPFASGFTVNNCGHLTPIPRMGLIHHEETRANFHKTCTCTHSLSLQKYRSKPDWK